MTSYDDDIEKSLLKSIPDKPGFPNLLKNRRGHPNTMKQSAKAALEKAFHDIGGVAALAKWGKDNRTEFYKLWGKIIPMSVDAKMQFERLAIIETPAPGTMTIEYKSTATHAGEAAIEVIEDAVIDELEQRQSEDDSEKI